MYMMKERTELRGGEEGEEGTGGGRGGKFGKNECEENFARAAPRGEEIDKVLEGERPSPLSTPSYNWCYYTSK